MKLLHFLALILALALAIPAIGYAAVTPPVVATATDQLRQ